MPIFVAVLEETTTTTCGPILIVDDDGAFRAWVAALLEREGFSTRPAATGEEALETLRHGRYSLVLLDVRLPGLSGYQVCDQIRERFGESVAVVFLSGTRTEGLDRTSGLLLGAHDYVTKPVEANELLARVNAALARSNGAAERPVARNGLTSREREVLGLLAAGRAQLAIAADLTISPKTVGTHIQRILGKLGVHSRAQAVALAHREQLV